MSSNIDIDIDDDPLFTNRDRREGESWKRFLLRKINELELRVTALEKIRP